MSIIILYVFSFDVTAAVRQRIIFQSDGAMNACRWEFSFVFLFFTLFLFVIEKRLTVRILVMLFKSIVWSCRLQEQLIDTQLPIDPMNHNVKINSHKNISVISKNILFEDWKFDWVFVGYLFEFEQSKWREPKILFSNNFFNGMWRRKDSFRFDIVFSRGEKKRRISRRSRSTSRTRSVNHCRSSRSIFDSSTKFFIFFINRRFSILIVHSFLWIYWIVFMWNNFSSFVPVKNGAPIRNATHSTDSRACYWFIFQQFEDFFASVDRKNMSLSNENGDFMRWTFRRDII